LPELQLRDISHLIEVNVPSIRAPLKGRDFDEWLAMSFHSDFKRPLGLFACGEESRVTHESLKNMGVDELHASLKIKLNDSIDKESKLIGLNLDLFQLGKIDVTSRWHLESLSTFLISEGESQAVLESLSFAHQEQGYFRRLSNYCSSVTGGLTRDEYSEIAARQWRLDMGDMGVWLDDAVEELYRGYLAQGGQLLLKFDLPKPLEIGVGLDLLDKNLSDYFGLSAYLNKQELPPMLIKLERKQFETPVIVPELKVAPVTEVNQENILMYRLTDIADLTNYLGHKANIIMKDGKAFTGALLLVSETSIQLTQIVQGGKVEYPLNVADIAEINVWRKSKNIKIIEATIN